MAVDLLGPLRQAYSARIASEVELANRREREAARQRAERANFFASAGTLAGAGIGFMAGGPAGAAAGASLGNMAGRTLGGGQAPSAAEVAQTGIGLYGLSQDQQQTRQNEQINNALTQNAINELQGGLPAGMTPESARAAQSSQRLGNMFDPVTAPMGGGEFNVAAGTSAPTESDQRLTELFGPGISSQTAPTAEQQKTLDSIMALQGMREGGLGRMKPGDVAAVAGSFLPKRGDFIPVGPNGLYNTKSGEIIGGGDKDKKPITFWTRTATDKPWQVRTASSDSAVGQFVDRVGDENVTLKDPTDKRSGEVTVAKDIRSEYRKDIGTFTDAQEAVRNIMSAQPNVAGDTSLVYNIARLNDPNGRAVTDSDIRVNALNGNYGLQVKNWMESVLATGTLSEEARAQVKQQAVSQYQNRFEEYQKIKGRTERLAERFGVDKNLVVYDEDLAIETPDQLRTRLKSAAAPSPEARKTAVAAIGAAQTDKAAETAVSKLTPQQINSLAPEDIKGFTPVQRAALDKRLKAAGF